MATWETLECTECSKVLDTPSSLYQHIKIHKVDPAYQCPHCPT